MSFHHGSRRLTLSAGGLAIAAAGLVACGAGGASSAEQACGTESVAKEIAGLDPADREARLVDLAEDESPPTIYAVLGQDALDALDADFQDRYGIRMNIVTLGTGELSQRLAQEARAGSVAADVVDNEYNQLIDYQDQGLLAPLDSPSLDDIPAEVQGEAWGANRYNVLVALFSSRLDAPPTGYEDLADPRWKGRIAVNIANWDLPAAVSDHWAETKGWSQEESLEEWRLIVQNSVSFDGNTAMADALEAGDVDVALSFQHYYTRHQAAGDSIIEWEPALEPVLFRPQGIGITCHGPSPAAATLLADYLLSEPAQTIMGEVGGSTPSNEDIELGVNASDGDFAAVYAGAEMLEESEFWIDQWQTLLLDAPGQGT